MKKILSLLITASLLLFLASCPDPIDPRQESSITNRVIRGVTVPQTYARAVTAIANDVQFTGTVTWNPTPTGGLFQPETPYTATINLTPTALYTVQGVGNNFFTVAGATATNPPNSGTITAVFPATGGTDVQIDQIVITPPVANGIPDRELDRGQYKINIAWSPTIPQGGTFGNGVIYTASITLVPSHPALNLIVSPDIQVQGAAETSYNSSTGIITATYPPSLVGQGWAAEANVTHSRQPTLFSAETSKITFTFSTAPANLIASNITITNIDGAVTKGGLTREGNTYVLEVSDVKTGNIRISIAAGGVEPDPKTIGVYGEQDLRDILNAMSRQQRANQMIQDDRQRADSSGAFPWGSMLGNAWFAPNAATGGNTVQGWTNRLNRLMDRSPVIDVNGVPTLVPAVYGIDAVHGHHNLAHAIMLPHQVGLGAIATGDMEKGITAAYESGRITAEELMATNIRWTFSPCGGVAENNRWGRAYETYGRDLETVTNLVLANVRGLQDHGVGACIKHWVGEGQARGNNPNNNSGNRDISPITPERFLEIASVYETAYETWSIMPSYLGVNIEGSEIFSGNIEMHRHKPSLQDYFKDEVGWNGMVIGDYRWHRWGNSPNPNSINAGVDCVMSAERSTDYLTDERNTILNECTDERINDAVMRMLRFKKRLGLFDEPKIAGPGVIRKDENVRIAREAAADSMVLLRNKNDLIQKIQAREFTNIMVAGRASEGDIGRAYQCGCWTIGWQGGAGDIRQDGVLLVTAVTVHEGIDAVKGSDITVTSSPAGNAPGNFDLIIAVLAETPYSESQGDVPNEWGRGGLILGPDQTMLNNVYAKQQANPNTKILVVMFTGRPIAFTSNTGNANNNTTAVNNTEYLNWDGLIAAWLPGDRGGEALADLLFTDREFVGKTPQPWHRGIEDVGPLVYPYGHGLRKSDPIDTDPGLP